MQGESLTTLLPGNLAESDLLGRVSRGKRYRSVGWVGALSSVALIVVTKLIAQPGGAVTAILFAVLAASLTLIAWTRLWFKESKEPFQYTYSVGEFEPMQGADPIPVDRGPIRWLTRDLTKKLSERVQRLSFLEDDYVPAATPDGTPASHVHISGWYGLRRADGWELEVVPEVRLGGKGAPAKLARAVRFKLGGSNPDGHPGRVAPRLTDEDYGMLFEQVYWSVASQIYAQIHRGVEEKVQLLPRGSLRAAAYVHEADDYATSNTLDAYEAARKLYRQALEVYDIGSRDMPATPWRQKMTRRLIWVNKHRRAFRRFRAGIWRHAGRREVMTARAELGLARMLVAEWHLRRLCGMIPKEIYEAAGIVNGAIERLGDVPEDVADQQPTLFRAHVTRATIRLFLKDRPGARKALREAERLVPGGAREDADFLFAAGMVEPDRLRSLRLLGQAVELNPTMERALFHRAQQYDEIWRRRETFEPEIAEMVDAEYKAVITLNPGNLSAWARRGYLGWLLAGEKSRQPSAWQQRAIAALEAGRQYKEVRREATVAELDWTMARLLAEKGDFAKSYEHYIGAVSARLANPAIDFEKDFHLSPTEALVNRFREYGSRVRRNAAEAEKKHQASKRLISSVKAFVYNDCGLVYQAHYDRSGRERDLLDAGTAFERARKENRAFVLPAYNLARLYIKVSEQPGRSPEQREAGFRDAEEMLNEVLQQEPDWAPARLLMVETQAELAKGIGGELEEVERGASGNGSLLASYPVAEAAMGNGAEVTPAINARVNQLTARQDACYESLERHLRHLLPHGQLFVSPHEHRVDARGTHVESLAEDTTVRWTKDFSELHVSALVQWVKVLVITAPAAASRLCSKLREAFYRADTDLLIAHYEAVQVTIKSEASSTSETASIAEECKSLLREIVKATLREDPAHFFALKRTLWLTRPERRQALDEALAANPSATALIWVGDALRDQDEAAGAMQAYEHAARSRTFSIARVASLKLAQLEERRDMRDEAIGAYREATHSKDVPVAAEARAGVARLLLEEDKESEARDEYLTAASNPKLALHLAPRLQREGREDDAILVYREALTGTGTGEAARAKLQFQLGLALKDGEGNAADEAKDNLRAAAESSVFPVRWEAAVILARMLVASEPDEAQTFYRRALRESDSAARVIAARELGGMLEAAGETEAARELYDEAGITAVAA